jgi:hypothetical protein
MHRSEERDLGSCVDCGAEITPASDRGYSFGTRGVLCMECALRRGGEYDSGDDRWVQSPDLAGLEREYE